jgi:citrate lyase subunit beta/citryl-CoA lyase
MKMRSLLFVPGDSERKFAKARGIGADVLIVDLEDSVAPANKEDARAQVAALLKDTAPRDWAFFVRPNALDSGLTADDLAAVVRPGLDGLLIPKADSAADVETISSMLEPLERAAGMVPGSVRIAVIATETPIAMFNLGSFTPPHPRLVGLTWGAEDLATAIGATSNKDENGHLTEPFRLARNLCLFGATAAGVAPIDGVYTDFRDAEGLETDCRNARRDGFTGRLAIHPDQVAIINRCFTPSEEEVAHARMVIDAFAANPGAGTLGIGGKMYDIPHLKAAQKVVAAAG